MAYTIYDEGIWQRLLEKYNLKEVAINLDVYENSETAKKMLNDFHGAGYNKLSQTERKFCLDLLGIEFAEQNLLDMIIAIGAEHYSVGAGDYVQSSMHLILQDFESSFADFLFECEKRDKKLENIKFKEAYAIFLDVIKLKIKYQVPYTKLFVRKLLSLAPECFKNEESLEVKEYFLEHNPKLLLEIQDELKL